MTIKLFILYDIYIYNTIYLSRMKVNEKCESQCY